MRVTSPTKPSSAATIKGLESPRETICSATACASGFGGWQRRRGAGARSYEAGASAVRQKVYLILRAVERAADERGTDGSGQCVLAGDWHARRRVHHRAAGSGRGRSGSVRRLTMWTDFPPRLRTIRTRRTGESGCRPALFRRCFDDSDADIPHSSRGSELDSARRGWSLCPLQRPGLRGHRSRAPASATMRPLSRSARRRAGRRSLHDRSRAFAGR